MIQYYLQQLLVKLTWSNLKRFSLLLLCLQVPTEVTVTQTQQLRMRMRLWGYPYRWQPSINHPAGVYLTTSLKTNARLQKIPLWSLWHMAKCHVWHIHRVGRITASTFHNAIALRDSTDRASIVKKIMQYDKSHLKVPAVEWGRTMEETACIEYQSIMVAQLWFIVLFMPYWSLH